MTENNRKQQKTTKSAGNKRELIKLNQNYQKQPTMTESYRN